MLETMIFDQTIRNLGFELSMSVDLIIFWKFNNWPKLGHYRTKMLSDEKWWFFTGTRFTKSGAFLVSRALQLFWWWHVWFKTACYKLTLSAFKWGVSYFWILSEGGSKERNVWLKTKGSVKNISINVDNCSKQLVLSTRWFGLIF